MTLKRVFIVKCFASLKEISTPQDPVDSITTCDTIQGISVPNSSEVIAATTLVQEACTAVEINSGHTFSLMPKDADIQELSRYFSRPQTVIAGFLPTAVRQRHWTQEYTAASILSSFTNGLSRVTGIYGYRCTMVYTLQVTATPFHQGVLSLNWQYNGGGSYLSYDRSLLSETSTNISHVRLDLSKDTMVQLRIPYIGTQEYLPMETASSYQIAYGSVALNTLLEIPVVAGLNAPPYQIMLHLEDMEFFGVSPLATANVTLQSGKKAITAEFESDAYPLSSSTMALSRAVKWFGQGVPLLSSYAGPASWFLEKAAGAIRSFGWARPQIMDPVGRVCLTTTINESNVDLATPACVAGPFAGNMTKTSSMFSGCEADEMSFSYILSKYSQIGKHVISTGNTAGTRLYVALLSPSAFWFRVGISAPLCNVPPRAIAAVGKNAFTPSNLFFLGQNFKFWRGGFRFRFTFSKTPMHAGRVMVVYAPRSTMRSEVSTIGTLPVVPVATYGVNGPDPTAISAIFNLKDGSVFEFDVPFTSPIPYLKFTEDIGTLTMYVVDAIQAPSMVANNLPYLVEVCALPDFEFASIRSPLYPVQPNASTSTIQLQSGSKVGSEYCEYTIGEKFNSVKQMIAIPKVTRTVTSANTLKAFTVPPWFYTPYPSIIVPAPTAHLSEAFSLGGILATAYSWVKGGTDLHVYAVPNSATTASLLSVAPLSTFVTDTTGTQTPSQTSFSNNPRVVSTNGVLHARLPMLGTLLRYPSQTFSNLTPTGTAWGPNASEPNVGDFELDVPSTLYRCSLITAGACSVLVSRSASDDAALGGYIGPVPLLLLSTNTAATLYDVDSVSAFF